MCSHTLRQGGGLPGAGSGLVGWRCRRNDLFALDNIKQLYSDKNPFAHRASTSPDWSQFYVVSRCRHNLSQRRTSKGPCVLMQQLNTSLFESEKWEDGNRFYLGATQLQITHKISPFMIKAKEKRGFTFPFPSLCTSSASSSSTCTSKEKRRSWRREAVIAQWA